MEHEIYSDDCGTTIIIEQNVGGINTTNLFIQDGDPFTGARVTLTDDAQNEIMKVLISNIKNENVVLELINLLATKGQELTNGNEFTQVTEAVHAKIIDKYQKDTSSILKVVSDPSGRKIKWMSGDTIIGSLTYAVFTVRTDLYKHYNNI